MPNSQRKHRVFIVDDEANMGRVLVKHLTLEGYEGHSFTSPAEALEAVRRDPPQVLVSDLRMPGMTGEELLVAVRATGAPTQVILMTAYGTIENAMKCVREGAFDYVTKPFDTKALMATIRAALNRVGVADAPARTPAATAQRAAEELLGCSPAIERVRELIRRVAASEVSVLIKGESGTGKELVARSIHRQSLRAAGPFVAINCASIPEALLESELFGHERGAFTGAVQEKVGLVESAGGGTLFLDEIGEMPLSLQAKLLRVLQEREITPVGSTRSRPVDVRVLAATNRDLADEIRRGGFREDLYFRLNVVGIEIPPLRRRVEDIPILAEAFLKSGLAAAGRKKMCWTGEATHRLTQMPWRGNVRELQNLVQRLQVLWEDTPITATAVSRFADQEEAAAPGLIAAAAESQTLADYREAKDAFDLQYLQGMLKAAGGNVSEAARRAGMSRRHFYEKMEKFGISSEALRGPEE